MTRTILIIGGCYLTATLIVAAAWTAVGMFNIRHQAKNLRCPPLPSPEGRDAAEGAGAARTALPRPAAVLDLIGRNRAEAELDRLLDEFGWTRRAARSARDADILAELDARTDWCLPGGIPRPKDGPL